MIRSFADAATEAIWQRRIGKRLSLDVAKAALRKLRYVDAAASLADLRIPPGNRREALKGDRARQHSIRVNDQYRICFVWRGGDAYEVEIVDYH